MLYDLKKKKMAFVSTHTINDVWQLFFTPLFLKASHIEVHTCVPINPHAFDPRGQGFTGFQQRGPQRAWEQEGVVVCV